LTICRRNNKGARKKTVGILDAIKKEPQGLIKRKTIRMGGSIKRTHRENPGRGKGQLRRTDARCVELTNRSLIFIE